MVTINQAQAIAIQMCQRLIAGKGMVGNAMKKLLTIYLLLVSKLSLAQPLTFPIERPTISKGDTWKYQYTNLWKNEVSPGQSSLSVALVDDKKINFAGTNREGGVWKYSSDLDLNRSYSFKGEKHLNREYVWPLTENSKWENNREFAEGEAEVKWTESCKVASLEKVKVPAGEFESVKVECKVNWTNSLNARGNGEKTRWYSPQVKRVVKTEEKWWVGSRLHDQSRMELTEYASAK
jgi:hypothetical protein